MIRTLILIAVAALAGGCATTYEDRYVYYPGDAGAYDARYGGDYYYDEAPPSRVYVDVGLGYDPYDSLLWGLRYSYFDPFWYPDFHYGVTYFPRYYHGSNGYAADYWAWRHFNPYSPWYGSYWDHYYAWRHDNVWHRRPSLGGHGDPQRYGSARNAAERMAWERGLTQRSRGLEPTSPRWATGEVRASGRPRWRSEGLPSRGYAPHADRRALGTRHIDGMSSRRSVQGFGRDDWRRDAIPGLRASPAIRDRSGSRSFDRPHGMPRSPAAPARSAPSLRAEPRAHPSRSFDRPAIRTSERSISRGDGGRSRSRAER